MVVRIWGKAVGMERGVRREMILQKTSYETDLGQDIFCHSCHSRCHILIGLPEVLLVRQ